QADEHEMPPPRGVVGPGVLAHRNDATYAAWVRTSWSADSPPNLRGPSLASTSAVIVSATTPAAGTAVTSVRSLNETVSALVSVSAVFSTGRFRVASGFIATRATSRSPVVIPPSMPPARDDSRRYSPASASQLIASWATLARVHATGAPE